MINKRFFALDNNPLKVKTGSIKFDCPDCHKTVDIQDAFTEEKLGGGLSTAAGCGAAR
jgi:hypothetical protein